MLRPVSLRTGAWVGLAVEAFAFLLSIHAPWAGGSWLLVLGVVQWGGFALGAAAILRAPARVAMPVMLAGAVLLQIAALSAVPSRSDDVYRYLYDGHVQAAGVDPYRYAPNDPATVRLRDPFLFPTGPECAHLAHEPVCTRLNRSPQRTLYPPLAEAAFVVVELVTPTSWHSRRWQLMSALLALLTTWLLARVAGDPRRAVLWAWCPVVALEAGNGAHIDVLAALLALGGLVAAARRRPIVGGVLIGAAMAVKLYPALVLGGLLRRRPAIVAPVAAGVLALSYVPHVLAVGTRVVGYLPGYLREEGYNGRRFGLLTLVVPDRLAPVLAVAVLLAVTAVAARRLPPYESALVVTGVAFLVATPLQGWYGLLLVALAALVNRPEWLAVAGAGFVLYTVHADDRLIAQRLSYGTALTVVLAITFLRRARRTSLAA